MSAAVAVLVAITLLFADIGAAVATEPGDTAAPSPAASTISPPNAHRPLSGGELLRFMALPRGPSFRREVVVAEATILRDRPTRTRPCNGRKVCAFGILERPGVEGGEPVVKARTSVAARFPSDDSPVEGTLVFSASWSGTRLDGPLAMPTGSYTVAIEPDAMALADALPLGSIVAVEGWLSRIGDETSCDDLSGDPADSPPVTSPFATCPTGWLTAEPVETIGPHGTSPLGQPGIRVPPIAIERFSETPRLSHVKPAVIDGSAAAEDALGVPVRMAPAAATYLLASRANPDPDGQPAVGWSVIARLDPVDLPDTSGGADLPVGAAPSGLAWESVPDAHPPLDGRDVQTVAWAGGFASIQASPDGLLTAWRSPDGHDWERAPLPRSIRRVRSLLPHRDGLVLMTNPRNRDSASFDFWRSDDALTWKRAGSLRLKVPARYRDRRQLWKGPWSLDGRLVLLTTYTTAACCGSTPGIFLAAQRPVRARRMPSSRTSVWVSRDGRRWSARPTRGLNSVARGAGEEFGYLEGYQGDEVLATLHRSESLGRSRDGLHWLKDIPLPETFDDSSPAVVARTPTGFVLAGESFDGGPGDGNWLTIWHRTGEGAWTRVLEHGQRGPEAIAVSGSTVVIAGDELDLATIDDDQPRYLPWIAVSTDGGETWDESLGWTGTVPMCPNELAAHEGSIVLVFGCAPPGTATTYVADL